MPGVHVLLAEVGATPETLPACFWQRLSQAERDRANRYRRDSDRVQFIAARGILHSALRRLFGVDNARIEAVANAKPVLLAPSLPPGLDFNLSHADGLVACAIGLDLSVGIDVERRDRLVDATAIAAGHFAPAEWESARSMTTFLRLWTLKEAVTKAVGLGLSLPLQDFVCALDPPCLLSSNAALGPSDTWHLRTWIEKEHYVALGVCCGSVPDVRVERINLKLGGPVVWTGSGKNRLAGARRIGRSTPLL